MMQVVSADSQNLKKKKCSCRYRVISKSRSTVCTTKWQYLQYHLSSAMEYTTLALFPGPKRRKGLVSAVQACANCGAISPPLHTIDILLYARDARINTKRNTVHRFMKAKYGMQETHSIVLIQWPIWSYKLTVRAPMELADKKKRLPTGKPSQEVTWASTALFLLQIFIDKQHKAVGKGTEIKAS